MPILPVISLGTAKSSIVKVQTSVHNIKGLGSSPGAWVSYKPSSAGKAG